MTQAINQEQLKAALDELTLENFRREWSSSGKTDQDIRFQKSLVRDIAAQIFEDLGGGKNPEGKDDAWKRATSNNPTPPEVQTYHDAIEEIAGEVHERWDYLADKSGKNGVSGHMPIRAELSCTISTPSLSEINSYSRSCGFSGQDLAIEVYASNLVVRCVDPKHDRKLISIIDPNEDRASEIQSSLTLPQHESQSASIGDIKAALTEIEKKVQAIVEELTNAPDVPVHINLRTNISH